MISCQLDAQAQTILAGHTRQFSEIARVRLRLSPHPGKQQEVEQILQGDGVLEWEEEEGDFWAELVMPATPTGEGFALVPSAQHHPLWQKAEVAIGEALIAVEIMAPADSPPAWMETLTTLDSLDLYDSDDQQAVGDLFLQIGVPGGVR